MPERGVLVPHRVFWAVLVGSLLLELAWVVALPAFRGADEFDHAYKADAVAHGQLRGDTATPRGRGQLVSAERALVAAAGPVCASYDYTGPDNCGPADDLPGGRVLVGSGAASYNPAFYAVVGTVARPFDGASALFAMRVSTAVLTSLLLAAAAAITARWARTTWPLLALALACTPVLVQSAGVAAPNAVGYAGGCLAWAAGLGLVRRPERSGWLLALGLGAVVMFVTHSTGLMWWACAAVTLLFLLPLSSWRALVGRHAREALATAALVGATAAACVAWILTAGTNRLTPAVTGYDPMRLADLLQMQFLWAFQTVAAFPMRNEMAPVPVYLMWWVALLALAVLGLRAAGRRDRLAAGALLVLWVAVPLVLTVLSYASEGYAWQGRYALPLVVGVPALAGLALDRREVGPPRAMSVSVLALTGLAHLVSVVDVTASERRAGTVGTLLPSLPAGAVAVGILATVGLVVVTLAGRAPSAAAGTTEPSTAPDRRTAVGASR